MKVDFSLEDMDLSEFKGKATYEQIKAYVLEHTGLKVPNLYIAQIKKKCGLDVGENFNLRKATRRMDCLQFDSTTVANLENENSQGMPKSENTRQPQCTLEKEDAIMQAFRHFGIV